MDRIDIDNTYQQPDIDKLMFSVSQLNKIILEREKDCKTLLENIREQDSTIRAIQKENDKLAIKCELLDEMLFRIIDAK